MSTVREARRRAGAQWFGLLGGMSAFALHLLSAFYLVPFSCFLGTRGPIYGVTALLGGVAVAAILVSWRLLDASGQHERPEWRPGRGSRGERARFMAQAGLILNVMGLAIILFAAAAMFAFDPCVNWQV